MFKVSEFEKSIYKPGEVAKLLGVTVKTIQNYDHQGKLRVCRNEANRRIILRDDLLTFMKEMNIIYDDTVDGKRDVIYARVSSHDQKAHGDLDRQALFLVEHVPDLKNPLIMKEVGSGLNDRRKSLKTLLQMVCRDEVRRVYVTYKDRLTRFGYHYLETMFEAHHVRIIAVKDKDSRPSVQEELVSDMMSLIASFSGKLYGLRSGKNRKDPGEKAVQDQKG